MLLEALTTRKTVTVGERLIVPYKLAEVTHTHTYPNSLLTALVTCKTHTPKTVFSHFQTQVILFHPGSILLALKRNANKHENVFFFTFLIIFLVSFLLMCQNEILVPLHYGQNWYDLIVKRHPPPEPGISLQRAMLS